MAMTLAEAQKLTQDMLLAGVIETIVTESPALRYLPFMEIVGDGLTYNRENAMATAAWYAVGGTWSESTPTFTKVTASLKILGGDADVDNYLQNVYKNPNDLEATVIAAKAKAVAYEFNKVFITGDDSADPNQFDGLDQLVPAGQQVSMGTNGGTLTLAKLDELIDKVKPGKPDLLLMSKRSRRKLKGLRQASGNVLETGVDQFGRQVAYYDGVPIEVDDNVADSYTQGSNSDTSRIYAAKFGYMSGLMGITNGGIQVEPVGSLETKDARRTRIKWYCGLVLFSTLAAAMLTGVRD